jgi:hypothetical protein
MGGESIVVRRGEHGWQVGDEPADDLTSAMVLADLLAADLGRPAGAPAGPPRHAAVSEEDEAARLAVTVAQLEHALTARVRVEQAIGVLADSAASSPRCASAARRRATPGPSASPADGYPQTVDTDGITIKGAGCADASFTGARNGDGSHPPHPAANRA